MTEKAKGGRGKKAQNPYERSTVTLPPALRAWLDGEAHSQGVSRSEALALLLAQARDAQTSMTTKSLAPAVLPAPPERFPAASPPPLKPTPKKSKNPVPAAKQPETSKATAPAAPALPGAGGPLTAPLSADPLRVTGNKLSPAQTLICAGLQMSGAVAEFDGYERRWRVGFAGAPAREADLEELARMGVLEVTGEGQAAVYKLVKSQPPTSTTTPHQSSTKKGPRA